MNSVGNGFTAVMDSLAAAWERMVTILFRPFDLGKWFALGFTAWLATLGENGGRFNFPSGGGGGDPHGKHSSAPCGPAEMMTQAMEWCRGHLTLIIGCAAALFLLVVVLSVALCWLNSRGRFMFLDNIARNDKRIAEPWSEFRAEGNSLFWWRLWYGLGVLLPLALLWIGGTLWMVAESAGYSLNGLGGVGLWGWLRVALVALVLMVPLILAGIVPALLKAFGVPLMYKYRITAGAALAYVWKLFKSRWKWFVAYWVTSMAVGIAWVGAILAVTLLTCCIAGCVMALPYLSAVLLLPMTVFCTAWRVHFLELVHPELQIFPVPPPERVASTPPPPADDAPAPVAPAGMG